MEKGSGYHPPPGHREDNWPGENMRIALARVKRDSFRGLLGDFFSKVLKNDPGGGQSRNEV